MNTKTAKEEAEPAAGHDVLPADREAMKRLIRRTLGEEKFKEHVANLCFIKLTKRREEEANEAMKRKLERREQRMKGLREFLSLTCCPLETLALFVCVVLRAKNMRGRCAQAINRSLTPFWAVKWLVSPEDFETRHPIIRKFGERLREKSLRKGAK